jgi:hypothetical protein
MLENLRYITFFSHCVQCRFIFSSSIESGGLDTDMARADNLDSMNHTITDKRVFIPEFLPERYSIVYVQSMV